MVRRHLPTLWLFLPSVREVCLLRLHKNGFFGDFGTVINYCMFLKLRPIRLAVSVQWLLRRPVVLARARSGRPSGLSALIFLL
jgi:hypothetical protein